MEPSRVVHPSAELLRALAVGKLDDGTAARVRSHLDSCPVCRAEVAATLNRPRQAHDSYATQVPAQSLSETARPPTPPLGPTTLFKLPPELAENPDYEVLRELGHGGMGVVYQARHKLSGRLEVLKVMNKALIGQPDSRERFLREIQAAARLDHRNVVKMYTALERGELMVLVMEFVEGEDLARILKARGPLPMLNACSYAQQAALGLQHAFEKGMVHRDIKPQNLMLAREGKKHIVKILDFGLAKTIRSHSVDTGLTGTGAMMGTPGYVAPEQILDAAKADIRADIYSLGCTLYHLLAGNPPFSGKSVFEIMQAHHAKEAVPLDEVRPEVPQELAALVRKMMAKKPDERYQTPAEMVQALGAAGKLAAKGTPLKSSPNVATPTVKTRSEEERRLLGAETILPSPEGMQATMRGSGAMLGAAGEISLRERKPPTQVRPAKENRKANSKMGLKKGFGCIAGATVVGTVIAVGIVLIWEMYFKGQSSKTTFHQQQAQAKQVDPAKSSQAKNSPNMPEKGNQDAPPAITPKSDNTGQRANTKPSSESGDGYDLTGGNRFVHFGSDRIRVVLTYNNEKQHFARVYDLNTGQALTPPLKHENLLWHASFSPDGQFVVTTGEDHTARVYDLATGQARTPPLKHTGSVYHASFSPDGQRVITASNDNTARIWEVATGKELTPPLKHENIVWHSSFSPDGRCVVTASEDHTARVWSTANGKEVIPPLKHTGSVYHASFSPDGQRVITASNDNTARIWEAATGKELTPPLKHEGSVLRASFSQDGRRVITVRLDSTAQLWDAVTGKELIPPPKHEVDKQNTNLPANLQKELQFETALANMKAASDEPDSGRRFTLYAQARVDFEKFLRDNPIHPRVDEALFEIARITSLQGKAQLSHALLEDDYQTRIAEGLKARATLVQAFNQLKALPASPETELAMGKNLFDQAETYLNTGSDKELFDRAKPVAAARAILEKLAEGESNQKVTWTARAWVGRCMHELGEPKKARDKYLEIIAATGAATAEGKRLARYFLLLVAKETREAPNKQRPEAFIMVRAGDWLRDYFDYVHTPEGYGVQYLLAEALLADALINNLDISERDRDARVIRARRYLREIERSENDFTDRAKRLKIAVMYKQGAFNQPIAKLKSFEDCYVRAQFEIILIAEDAKKYQGDKDQIESARKARIAAAIEALEAALNQPDAHAKSPDGKSGSSTELNNARAMLAHYLMNEGKYKEAIEVGATFAKNNPRSNQSAISSIYPLLSRLAGRASLSPNGQLMVCASWDTVQIWDTTTGKEISFPLKQKHIAYYVSFTADGKRVITINEEQTVQLWDAATGEELKKVAISPD